MRTWLAAIAALAATVPLVAQTSYPMVTHIAPVAVQRGTTAEVTVEGQQTFYGAYKVLIDGTGVTAEVVDKPPARPAGGPVPLVKSVKVKVTAAADAPPGIREVRVVTALGPSSVGQLVIAEHPVVSEKGNNNSLEKLDLVPVPSVVSGKIEAAEDVDFYKFRAAAGQTFTFEVACARIQDRIHDLQKHADPMLAVFDAEGRELAANDDFYFADPGLSCTFKQAGDYFVQVRDAKYEGDPRWVYALLITDRPHVTHVYPMVGNPGQTVVVEPVGSAALKQARATLVAPTRVGFGNAALDLGGGLRSNPVPFLVSELAQILEQEPNDAPEKATRVTVPSGLNGRIEKARDLDHFVFKATKGKAIRFEVKARRFGTPLASSLDSVLDVIDAKGTVVATADDTYGKDAALVFTPPADADYVLRVRDLNSKGGATAVYHVEADWSRPDFTLRCDPDKALIGPGSRTAWYAHVVRANGFAGPVKVEVRGSPPGVTVNALTIPPTMTQGVLVVSAAADAQVVAGNVEVIGTATAAIDGKETTLIRTATPNQEIYFPGGGRGRFDVRTQTVGVTEPSDVLKVLVTPETVTLKPGEEVKLDVTIERRPGFTAGVSLDIPLRHLGSVFGDPLPPGVTLVEGKSKTLLGNGSKGHIVLKAAPTAAPLENVPICVLANVSINFVIKISYASAAIPVSVRK